MKIFERFIVDINTNIVFKVKDSYITESNKKEKKVNKKLIGFLNKSDHLSMRLDLTKSLFSDKLIEHTQTLRTDGHWIWSGDLRYYTEEHYFKWPEQFIKHALSANKINISGERREFIEERYNIDVLLNDYQSKGEVLCMANEIE